MKKLFFSASVVVIIAALLLLGIWLSWPEPPAPVKLEPLLSALLDSASGDFAEVDPGRPLRFPADHADHSEFRTETWYFNGSLQAEPNYRFGFQLTFFRIALSPQKPQGVSSAWATNQVYRAHLAITDAQQDRFYAFERFSREALGLAGAQTAPVAVWLENWRMQVGEDSADPLFELSAAADNVALKLRLQAVKPLIDGLTPGPGADTAPFRAYLLPRLSAGGELSINEQSLPVQGTAWFDHAWGLVPAGQGQLALNRFIVQLDDHREILIFQTRRRDGSGQPVNSGVLIHPDGSTRELRRRDIELEATQDWQSERSAIRYPTGWRLGLPGEDLQITLEPLSDDQELNLSLRYWAGTMRVAGHSQGQPVSGNGYIELSGYTAAQ